MKSSCDYCHKETTYLYPIHEMDGSHSLACITCHNKSDLTGIICPNCNDRIWGHWSSPVIECRNCDYSWDPGAHPTNEPEKQGSLMDKVLLLSTLIWGLSTIALYTTKGPTLIVGTVAAVFILHIILYRTQ